ncbi:MAG: hypothetical protein EOO73_24520 [Myxococcales bacterium]|nr:MAG: hypothetical protein EOO73_24520 [Myxococcales bacterium]
MGFFDRFRGSWSLTGVARPWPDGESIYEHLRRHTLPSGALDDAALTLGDEALQEPSRLRWAAGALDGVFGHHVNRSTDGERVDELAAALVAVLTRADSERLRQLYLLATREPLLGIVDRLTDRLRDATGIQANRVHALGDVLAREAPHREAVKLGLALIGSIEADDTELILALGVHDEFTLFAAVALVNQNREQAERALFQLAQRVDGWGRIQVVERLVDSQDPEVQGWLLRDGFRNSVMDEYLAYTAAMGGKLHVALSSPAPDAALLKGAAGILRALANGGPAQDLADYPHADAAVAAFLEHLESGKLNLEELSALDALAARSEPSSALQARIRQLRESAEALRLIEEGLSSGEDEEFLLASAAARARGVSTFAHDEARVKAGQLSLALSQLMQGAEGATIDRALDAAAPHVPLTSIATGPSLELGLRAGFEPHAHLETIVNELARFPGKGIAFLGAALQSPTIRNRNVAVRTLAAWTKPQWPNALLVALERAIAQEPSAELKRGMERVLAGGDFEELEDDADEESDDDEPADPSPLLH